MYHRRNNKRYSLQKSTLQNSKEINSDSSEDFLIIDQLSTLTYKVKKKLDRKNNFKIIKNYDGVFNDISVYNEIVYYLFSDFILKKARIKNPIPKREILNPPISLWRGRSRKKISSVSCLIEYLGEHSRVTMENEKRYTGSFPYWIYFIDVWLGRLDCNGDSNLVCTKEKKIIPIDFNLICTWYDEEHPWFIDYKTFNFEHFIKIKTKKNYRILKIIKEIKEKKILEILNSADPDHKIIPLEIKEKYLEGLLYRRDNLLMD
jgi:hypothetical protein